jgi:GNAT superfamily N-acetyltransferase
MIEIAYLVDHPQHLRSVAGWVYDEWHRHRAGETELFVHDMQTRRDLSPWLAAVYVTPERRGAGVGSQLVGAAEEIARQLGVGRLHLFTPDRERFYTRLGWRTQEHSFYDDHPVVIMTKSLSS